MSTVSDIFGDGGADGDEMSRSRLISDATADHLLAGGEADDTLVQDLAQVLAAASAPGRAEELMWEDVAVAAFAAAHLAPTPAHRRRPMIKTVLVNALGLKLAAAALAAAVGGLAFAASTGVLPSPLHPAPATTTPSNGSATPSGSVQPSRSPGTSRSTGSELSGWCNAYLNAGSAEEMNKHLTADLIAAAGGADKVTDYCAALIGSSNTKPSTKPSAKPSTSPPTKPTVSPPPRPDPSRKAKPSALPSHR